MNQAFQFNLIRFQPNVETEEFAVVGVVAYSANTRQLAFRLLETDQYKRVQDFFNHTNERVLPSALQMIEGELQRVQKLLPDVKQPDALYAELVREREDIIRFASTSVMLGEQIQESTDNLFKRYVQHDYPMAA